MSTPHRNWITAMLALGLGGVAFLSTSCDGTTCGDGTIEQDGVCVPAGEVVDEANCGQGTVLGASGACEPELPPAICGDNTVENTVDMPGTIICEGTGGGGCTSNLTCPQADANKVSVCGRIHNVDDDTAIGIDSLTQEECIASGGTVTTGACQFDVKFYDALEFAGNPTGATPIAPQDFVLDECGRFYAHNLNRPSLGFLGIAVDDRAAAADDHRLTGVAFPVISAETRNRQRAYVIKRSTDEQWTADSGLTGSTLIDRGLFMSLFRIGGLPAAGVQITEATVVEAANDYYFSDVNPLTRITIDPSLDVTGANGAGVKINSALVDHSGSGGSLPAGCAWESALGASVPGLLFFTSRVAVMGEIECE